MKRTKDLSEGTKLEFYRVALLNAKTDEQFAVPLNGVGYTSESIDVGNNLYEIARKAYNECLVTKKKRYAMHKAFYNLKSDLDEKFQLDWKKAKIVFKRDIIAQNKLALNNPFPKTYIKWLEYARLFYNELSNNPELTERLSERNYSNEDTEARLKAILEIEVARAAYIFEKGISQNATTVKNKAFENLNEWMDEFLSLAKIAFRRKPQLMESLGVIVKN